MDKFKLTAFDLMLARPNVINRSSVTFHAPATYPSWDGAGTKPIPE